MTIDALLANLRHASTNSWKVNKNKNLIKFSCGRSLLFQCELFFWINKIRSNRLVWRSGTRSQYGVPKWYEIAKRLGTPNLEHIAITTQAMLKSRVCLCQHQNLY